jgi:hypothetical protein
MVKSADSVAQILEAIGPAKKGRLMAKTHSASIPQKRSLIISSAA